MRAFCIAFIALIACNEPGPAPGTGFIVNGVNATSLAGSGLSACASNPNQLCVTGGGGATIAHTTDLIVGDGAGNGSAYAGSAGTGCTAGQVTTNESVSATGAVTNTCTQELPASTADILVGSNGSAVAYAGSTGTGCSAGSMTTNESVSAAGVVTNTCTAEMPASTADILVGSNGSAVAYAGSTPSACSAGSAATAVALSAAGTVSYTCTTVNEFSTTNTIPVGNGTTLVASQFADTGTVATYSGGNLRSSSELQFCTSCTHASALSTSITFEAGSTAGTISIGDANTGGITLGASGNALTINSPWTAGSTKNAGSVNLSGGTASVTVTSGTHCVCQDQTTAGTAVKCPVSSTTATFTGTGTDTITYVCM